jgi:hypothetical protein
MLALPVMAVGLVAAEFVWFFLVVLGLYFLAPTRAHFLYFDHVLLRVPVFVFVGLPALLGCAVAVETLRRFRKGEAYRVIALVMAVGALIVGCGVLAWLFRGMVVAPLSPYGPGYWVML